MSKPPVRHLPRPVLARNPEPAGRETWTTLRELAAPGSAWIFGSTGLNFMAGRTRSLPLVQR